MVKINIRGVAFDNVNMKEAVAIVLDFATGDGCKSVFTPNSEIVQLAIEDKSVMKTVNTADLIVPDGIGVIYASKILGTPLKEKVAGFELASNILPHCEKMGLKLFFLGGAPLVAEKAAAKIKMKYEKIKICGTHDGYFKNDDDVIRLINEKQPDILFVCLGAPKQEKWIEKNKDKINTKVMMGLGGSLDVFAGNVKRAPDIFIKLGLEWFYRLIKEPKRFFRMLKLPKFLFGTIYYKMGGLK